MVVKFESPPPMPLGRPLKMPDLPSTAIGCKACNMSWTKQYAPYVYDRVRYLEQWADIDGYVVDVKLCDLAKGAWMGVPYWHTDFTKPGDGGGGPAYMLMFAQPHCGGETELLTGAFDWEGSWRRFAAKAQDETPTGHVPYGQWVQYGPLTVHRATPVKGATRRLLVRVRRGEALNVGRPAARVNWAR